MTTRCTMSTVQPDPIPMRRVASESDLAQRGDFCWQIDDQNQRTLCVALPMPTNSLEQQDWFSFLWPIDRPSMAGQQWIWNNDENSPTLDPDLIVPWAWHGRVTAGELIKVV